MKVCWEWQWGTPTVVICMPHCLMGFVPKKQPFKVPKLDAILPTTSHIYKLVNVHMPGYSQGTNVSKASTIMLMVRMLSHVGMLAHCGELNSDRFYHLWSCWCDYNWQTEDMYMILSSQIVGLGWMAVSCSTITTTVDSINPTHLLKWLKLQPHSSTKVMEITKLDRESHKEAYP